MIRLGQVTIEWADGEYVFVLKIKQLIELQELCDAGPPYILTRLQSGVWRVNDVRETIRIGLIGGGMPPNEALKKVARYVDEEPLAYNALVAQTVISAALFGAPEGSEDAPPEKPEADQQTNHSHEVKSAGPHTSEPGLPPD